MDNKKQTKKKSKYNKLKVSPLIPIIAVIEIALLVCVCTYAWFTVASSKTAMSDLIKVDPDSGLEIDFADTDDGKIHINDYLNNFTFEPATSLDGRNIFFPTTGTFANATNTSASDMAITNKMTFREGTINDINSKYINIDFSLTNTSDTAIPVYLSSLSKFSVEDNSGNKKNSSALRFAFYKNDGDPGDTDGPFTIYFVNSFSDCSTPYIYLWTKNSDGETVDKNANYPGVPMVKYSGNIYSYTFDNNQYANMIFNDGKDPNKVSDTSQTEDIKCSDVHNLDKFQLTTYRTDNRKKIYSYSTTEGYQTPSGYAVVAPGTSTGFTRYYEPVLEINNDTGAPTSVTPAYAGAFDDYLYHKPVEGGQDSRNLFTIAAGEKVSLSLVIWLEGTDKGCVAEDYANLHINIDFLFATEQAGADNLFRYNFYDRTLETWVRNTGISRTGNLVNPVVMLYDNKDQKGYLMYNDSKQPELWYCDAPDYVCTHDIVFRRVNPADETDIWNWWEAGKCADMEQGSTKFVDYSKRKYKDTNGDTTFTGTTFTSNHLTSATVNFTAFGDSGLYATQENTNRPVWEQRPNLHSCGGAWGNHQTSEFCVVDGTQNTWYDDNHGILTMRFDLGGQHIEYKASPFRNSIYRFSLPSVVASSSSSYKINIGRYFNYMDNMSALEDENDNDDLKYSQCVIQNQTYGGPYLQAYADFNSSPSTNYYFGVNIVYLQIEQGNGWTDHYPYEGGAVFQLYFENKSNSSQNKYVQCRRDSAVGYSTDIEHYETYDTYPRVVPYENCKYIIQRRDSTGMQDWTSYTVNSYEFSKRRVQVNYSDLGVSGKVQFGEVDHWPISQKRINVYFTNNEGWLNLKAYYWGPGISLAWPGTGMTHVRDNTYRITIPANASGILFTDNGGSQTVDIIPTSDDANTKLEGGYGYYTSHTTDGKGHYKVTRWQEE